MYLKCHRRFKDGKEHRYWSIAEKQRISGDRTVDRHVLYLGEINDSQREGWMKSIEAFDEEHQEQRRLALFPADREIPDHARDVGVQVQLSKFQLKRPRQWGACWTFCRLWEQLQLDEFWGERLKDSREGTSWRHVLMVLTAYRWIDPGSEWRLHREWYQRSAMGYLLKEGVELAAKDTLSRLRRSMASLRALMRDIRHWSLKDQVCRLNQTLRGHYAYYGVAGNTRSLHKVYRFVERYWHKMLCSRSWAARLTWEVFHRLRDLFPLQRPTIYLNYGQMHACAVL